MSKKKLVSGFSLRHFMIVSSKIKKRFYPEQEKAVTVKVIYLVKEPSQDRLKRSPGNVLNPAKDKSKSIVIVN